MNTFIPLLKVQMHTKAFIDSHSQALIVRFCFKTLIAPRKNPKPLPVEFTAYVQVSSVLYLLMSE